MFRTKGYHAATMQDIADAVGILKGSLYHHFESKEEVLYLIVKEPISRRSRPTIPISSSISVSARK